MINITIDGKYQTRNGLKVTIKRITHGAPFGVWGRIHTMPPQDANWNQHGKYTFDREHFYDLIDEREHELVELCRELIEEQTT